MLKIHKQFTAFLFVIGITVLLGYVWILNSVVNESIKSEQQIFELLERVRNIRKNENVKSENRYLNKKSIPPLNILSDNGAFTRAKHSNNNTKTYLKTGSHNKTKALSESIYAIKPNDAKENDNGENKQTEDVNFDITDKDVHIYLVAKKLNNNTVVHGLANGAKLEVQSRRKVNNTLAYRKHIYRKFNRPSSSPFDINCSKIISGDFPAISIAHQYMRKIPRTTITMDQYINMADCDNFKKSRGYIEHPLSETERNFPLAFGIMVYKDIEQVERLLRSIYRPHNYYCIHADLKTSETDRKALEAITGCFDNVFLTEESINVTWGEFSVLEAELRCMKDTWKYKKWKYYINLTGQEFPLKTNREIVKILEVMDGANIVDGTWVRARERYFYRWTVAGHRPPHNIRPIKGSVHVAINREFVDFSLHDQRSLDFIQWLKKTEIPDETFFASLNHNPSLGIKGSFLGEPEEYPLKPSFMRYKNWAIGHSTFTRSCAGKFVRNICVLGIGDVKKTYEDIGLFANKFHLDFEYLALDCLEQTLYDLTWKQYLEDVYIDVSFYKKLDQVKFKLT